MSISQAAETLVRKFDAYVLPLLKGRRQCDKREFFLFLKETFDFSPRKEGSYPLTLEQICKTAPPQYSIEEIGTMTAAYLGAEFIVRPRVPRKILFSKHEHEISNLLASGFHVQNGAGEHETMVVTADPLQLIEARHKYTSPVLSFGLTTKGAFDTVAKRVTVFKQFVSRDEPLPRNWRRAFALCFLDALELGGTEIFFGMPDADSYEFTANGKKYGGSIDNSVRVQGLALLQEHELHRISHELASSERISFSKTSFREREVLVCRWGETPKSVTSLAEVIVKKEKRKLSPHILLVDDDRKFAELLKRGLVTKGFSVSIATSVNDALLYHLETSSDIDLIITDYHMPQMKGSDLVEVIRAKRGSLPLVVLTSDQQTETHVQMLSLGCDAVVNKGDDPRILFAWIFRLLEKHAVYEREVSDPGDQISETG
jgi:CheY-like chemotaxis protein